MLSVKTAIAPSPYGSRIRALGLSLGVSVEFLLPRIWDPRPST